VSLILLESSQWARSNEFYFVSFEPKMQEILNFKW